MIDVRVMAKESQDTDRIETLTFTPKTGEGQFGGPYTLYRAKRSAVDNSMFAGTAWQQQQMVNFRIFLSDLTQAAAPAPRTGDKFTDASGASWIVKNMPTLMLGQTYVCWCQQTIV